MPTLRGWLVILLITIAVFLTSLLSIHPFLALNAPTTADVLVVEGWAQDYVLKAAIVEFERGTYERLFVTGGPLERGAPLSEYESYAELGAASLVKLGMPGGELQAVPAPLVQRDRTYASALELRDWLEARGSVPQAINVMTVGAHSRRSRLLFQEAFGETCEIGVIAVENEDYPARRWWAHSEGVRTVINEWIGYLYVRLFFAWSAEPPASP